MKRKTIGLVLSSGSARGLAHIGILKVLHKYHLEPNYIAGVSMGAVVGALYAAGHSPEELQEIAKTTHWRDIVDFTIPKAGLISGRMVEDKISNLVHQKKFEQLAIPLCLIAYDLTAKTKVVFNKGDVAPAVRASISIPGIFAPPTINRHKYIDGGVSDPVPFDVVQDMGADIVIVVDLTELEKSSIGPRIKGKSFLEDIKEELVLQELFNIENYLFPKRWPGFIRKVSRWIFEKLLYPTRVLNILVGRDVPLVTKVFYDSLLVLSNNLARERIKNSKADIIVTPILKNISWADFDRVDDLVNAGEEAMEKEIEKLKNMIQL